MVRSLLRAFRHAQRRGVAVTVDGRLHEMSRRLRSTLATDEVLRATVHECVGGFGCDVAAVWVTTGYDEPRLAHHEGGREPLAMAPAVAEAVSGRRLVFYPSEGRGRCVAAMPLIAPRAGLLGVLHVECSKLDSSALPFLEYLAQESALALETATVYEGAVAARDRSEALLARVADAVVVTDPRGRVLHCNEAARWMIDPALDGEDHRCRDSLGLRVGERRLDCAEGCALLASLDSSGGLEVWRQREDGRRQPLLASASAVTDTEGAVIEVVHTLRDITRLKQADEAKTLFLATASHELKTPLTVIQGYSELLAAARLERSEDREEAARAIQRRAIQLNKIVDRLLLSSRIETGRVEVTVAEVDLAPILEERVMSLAEATGRDVVTELPSEIPTVAADADGLATVVDHLLDNAIKYSPDGGRVALRAAVGREHVEIVVADEGIGMDPEQAEHCFEKFWQAETTDVRRYGGTGIGLYIVRSLTEAMGGRVSVATAPGKGSIFTIRLHRWGEEPAATVPAPEPRAIRPEPSVIREFMRQIGIPNERSRR